MRGGHLFYIGYWARRWKDHWVCDAWPVRPKTYGYLRNRRASPPLGWYQITCILLTEAHECEQLAQSRYPWQRCDMVTSFRLFRSCDWEKAHLVNDMLDCCRWSSWIPAYCKQLCCRKITAMSISENGQITLTQNTCSTLVNLVFCPLPETLLALNGDHIITIATYRWTLGLQEDAYRIYVQSCRSKLLIYYYLDDAFVWSVSQ